jgi:putative acetyltransferase
MDNISLRRTTSMDPDFRTLIKELDADLRSKYDEMMNMYDQHNIIENIDTVVVAYNSDVPIGCGCFKVFDQETVEIKRMFVRTIGRGKGLSFKILNELHTWAAELGYTHTVLETGSKQTEALGLYAKAGYKVIPAYEPYVDLPDSICFRKML